MKEQRLKAQWAEEERRVQAKEDAQRKQALDVRIHKTKIDETRRDELNIQMDVYRIVVHIV